MSCIWARDAATSSPTDRPSLPVSRMPDSISCSVGSRVLPSMITERPRNNARFAGAGIHGMTLTPTLVTAPCTSPTQRGGGRLAPRCRPGAPGRLCVMAAPLVTLNDGKSIPAVGLGVFKAAPADTQQAVSAALRAGYRHIDTAAAYRNERETGRAVAESDVPREQLYVVTKLANPDQGYDSALTAFDASMDRLGLDYLDLYLIHWPQPHPRTFVDTFKGFDHLADPGRIRT